MEKYFIVDKGSKLYSDYFAWLNDKEKVAAAVNTVCKEFGIETKQFYLTKSRFHIVPTEKDFDKYKKMMMQNEYGAFKKNSPVSKRWTELVKGIEHFKKPQLFYYFQFLGHRWRERLFNIGATLYGSVECSGDIYLPDFVIEIKASEFYKIVEKMEK